MRAVLCGTGSLSWSVRCQLSAGISGLSTALQTEPVLRRAVNSRRLERATANALPRSVFCHFALLIC